MIVKTEEVMEWLRGVKFPGTIGHNFYRVLSSEERAGIASVLVSEFNKWLSFRLAGREERGAK